MDSLPAETEETENVTEEKTVQATTQNQVVEEQTTEKYKEEASTEDLGNINKKEQEIKEKLGLDKDEETPTDSIKETVRKKKDKVKVEEETTNKKEKETKKKEEKETTNVVIEDEETTKEVVVTVDKDVDVKVEDDTIIIPDGEDATIEVETEKQKENIHDIIKPKDPFANEYSFVEEIKGQTIDIEIAGDEIVVTPKENSQQDKDENVR